MSFSRYLDLPAELRCRILYFALDLDNTHHCNLSQQWYKDNLDPLLLTSKKIRSETFDVLSTLPVCAPLKHASILCVLRFFELLHRVGLLHKVRDIYFEVQDQPNLQQDQLALGMVAGIVKAHPTMRLHLAV